MVILHISYIVGSKYQGVDVVVPEHIKHQAEYASVGFINVNNVRIDGIVNQFDFTSPFNLDALPVPFNRPDLVVFHEAYRVEYLKISKILRKNKIPYIIIPHGELTNEAQKKKWLKKKVANLLLFNRFIGGAAAIQCLSERELNSTRFGKMKFVGTNGIDMPKKQKQSFNDGGIKFTYIGRLDSYIKGLDLLINAVAVNKRLMIENNCTLTLYGPDRFGRGDRIRGLISENGVSEIVTLKSEVSGETKESVLIASDVFVQTSRSEGMPMGILEALSYGLPVLITEGTTLGGYVKEYNAGWVAETSVDSIGRMFEHVVGERALLDKKSYNAVNLVKNNFEWSKIATGIVEKYCNIIKK